MWLLAADSDPRFCSLSFASSLDLLEEDITHTAIIRIHQLSVNMASNYPVVRPVSKRKPADSATDLLFRVANGEGVAKSQSASMTQEITRFFQDQPVA